MAQQLQIIAYSPRIKVLGDGGLTDEEIDEHQRVVRAFDRRIRMTKADEYVALERLVSYTTALARHYYPLYAQAGHLTIIGSIIKGTGTVPMGNVDGVIHLPAGTHEQ